MSHLYTELDIDINIQIYSGCPENVKRHLMVLNKERPLREALNVNDTLNSKKI